MADPTLYAQIPEEEGRRLSAVAGSQAFNGHAVPSPKYLQTRTKAKRRAKCLMYTGVLLIVLECYSLMSLFFLLATNSWAKNKVDASKLFELENEKIEGAAEAVFSPTFITWKTAFCLSTELVCIFQSCVMVGLAKKVIRQISSQEDAPQFCISKLSQKVEKISKWIYALIAVFMVLELFHLQYLLGYQAQILDDLYGDSNLEQYEKMKVPLGGLLEFKQAPSRQDRMKLEDISATYEATYLMINPSFILLLLLLSVCTCSTIAYCACSLTKDIKEIESNPVNNNMRGQPRQVADEA